MKAPNHGRPVRVTCTDEGDAAIDPATARELLDEIEDAWRGLSAVIAQRDEQEVEAKKAWAEVERLHYLLTESQTDLDNEREFRDADDQIAEMRADVIREEWQLARAERDALAAQVARVEEAMARLEADDRESLIRVGQHLHISADTTVRVVRAALAGEQ
ncbi:MAG: hypothetical protein KIT69_07385 [Propionibacteriaceae bacterium]|nr:hypothetical protein [Propionibacteriaceae bacterium]